MQIACRRDLRICRFAVEIHLVKAAKRPETPMLLGPGANPLLLGGTAGKSERAGAEPRLAFSLTQSLSPDLAAYGPMNASGR